MKIVLTVIEGPHTGRIFEFDRHDTFIVGRSKAAQFRLSDDDEYFSRNHFLLEVNPPLCRIMDLSSTNGTLVNGERISTTDLKHGDIIKGGITKLRISMGADSAALPKPRAAIGEETLVPRNAGGNIKGSDLEPSDRQPEMQRGVAPTVVPVKGGESPFNRSSAAPSFPGYRARRVLGRGGMGVVYEAESTKDGELVAIKVIHPHVAALPTDVSRFLREALILKELQHPNIVRFRDLDEVNGTPYIVMDYIDGQNANTLLKTFTTPMPFRRAVSLVLQLLNALQFAHDNGYVHRDVSRQTFLLYRMVKRRRVFWRTSDYPARTNHQS